MKTFCTLLGVVLLSLNSKAVTHVVSNSNDSGTGTLRKAITLAQNGDTVVFTPTMVDSTISLLSQIIVSSNIVIEGIVGSNLVTIQQGSPSGGRSLVVSSGIMVEIKHLLFIDGFFVNGTGAAILNNGFLQLDHCKFSNNVIDVGSTITAGGGAIFNNTTGELIISNCEFYDNQVKASIGGMISLRGGAIYNRGVFLQIDNSSFYNNGLTQTAASATSLEGGAMYSEGTVIINSSTFSGNFASTIGSTSPAQGGGIFNTGNLTINNSTLSNNALVAGLNPRGGNIWNGGQAYIYNSIIANGVIPAIGSGEDIYTVFGSGFTTSLGSNILENPLGSNMVFFSGDFATDPLLLPLAYEGNAFTKTHALDCASPAVNAGDSTTSPNYDQIGNPRVIGSSIDIGAIELQSTLTGPTIAQVGSVLSVPVNGTYQWFVDGSIIPGATGASFSLLLSGNYFVVVYDSLGCGPFNSDTVAVSLGVETNFKEPIVNSIYPNPAQTFINIEFSSASEEKHVINVYSSIGQLVFTSITNSEKVQLLVDDLENGIYLIEVLNSNGLKATERVVINH